MAMKVKFIDGIESMSGTMNCGYGKRITFTHRKGDKPGEGHARFWTKGDYKRSTPVTGDEILRRKAFAEAGKHTAEALKDESLCKAWAQTYIDTNGVVDGKKYKNLRGFIFGNIYQHLLKQLKETDNQPKQG